MPSTLSILPFLVRVHGIDANRDMSALRGVINFANLRQDTYTIMR